MRTRRETVEHPFATIKMRMGATNFLTKTLPKVATEMALCVLTYNLARVLDVFCPRPSRGRFRRRLQPVPPGGRSWRWPRPLIMRMIDCCVVGLAPLIQEAGGGELGLIGSAPPTPCARRGVRFWSGAAAAAFFVRSASIWASRSATRLLNSVGSAITDSAANITLRLLHSTVSFTSLGKIPEPMGRK